MNQSERTNQIINGLYFGETYGTFCSYLSLCTISKKWIVPRISLWLMTRAVLGHQRCREISWMPLDYNIGMSFMRSAVEAYSVCRDANMTEIGYMLAIANNIAGQYLNDSSPVEFSPDLERELVERWDRGMSTLWHDHERGGADKKENDDGR